VPGIDDAPAPAGTTAYGAVVLAADQVRWQVATRTWAELIDAVAAYVESHAPQQLWPDDAARVARWLGRGDRAKAIVYYFTTIGGRWDRERLHWVVPTEYR
jgi:hypothetical protein